MKTEYKQHSNAEEQPEYNGKMQGMVREHHEKWLWRDFTNILLGVWLIISPFTFGYASAAMI